MDVDFVENYLSMPEPSQANFKPAVRAWTSIEDVYSECEEYKPKL